MENKLERCRHCGANLPENVIYGDNNRKYCSESCARSQLDNEQGSASGVAKGGHISPAVGDRVGKDHGFAQRRGGGPTMR